MADDKKKIAAMLVMGLKKKPDAGMPPDKGMPPKMGMKPDAGMDDSAPDDDSEPSDDEAAGQEVLDAIKSGDAAGFAEAMKSFVKMCGYSDEPDSDDSGDEGM